MDFVSAASIAGLYVAINNNVDVGSLFDKLHLPGFSKVQNNQSPSPQSTTNPGGVLMEQPPIEESTVEMAEEKRKNRMSELAGGTLALAVIWNKAILPVGVPITVALTPPIARFLARRNIIKNVV